MTDVEISNLTKKFGSLVAVDDVSFTADSGNITTLLGPSGCGKTTLLRCIAGLETPTSGEIRMGDEVVYSSEKGINKPPRARKIGMVFQLFAVWPHLTVFENVAYPLKRQNVPKEEHERRTMDILVQVGLEGKAQVYPPTLSGGQQQRVALARSLVPEPSTLLLDEPLSNLDAKLRNSLRKDLDTLQQELEITTIYVTHNQRDAFALCDKVGVMQSGKMVQMGVMDELFEGPRNTFISDFIGVDNILPGRFNGTHIETGLGDIKANNSNEATAGQSVHTGVRAEDVRISHEEFEGTENCWEGTIKYISPHGWDAEVELESGRVELLSICSKDEIKQFKQGDKVYISTNPEKVYLIPEAAT